MNDPKNKREDASDPQNSPEKHTGLQPDPETLKTTDPQEHMEGPVSSVMQNIKHEAEEGNKESKEEADEKKDKNT